MRITIAFLFSLCIAVQLSAQTGVIKGTVLDQQSEMPIIGATVQLMSDESASGAVTDIDGYFTITNVPIGRNIVQVTYVGYAPQVLPNIEVTSGKEES